MHARRLATVLIIPGLAGTLLTQTAGLAAADPPGTQPVPLIHNYYHSSVALGPGRVYATDYNQGTGKLDVNRFAVSKSGGTIMIGNATLVGSTPGNLNTLTVSANRVLYGNSILRYEGSPTGKQLSPASRGAIRLSGNRALFGLTGDDPDPSQAQYNIRTGASSAIADNPVDLWGEYFAYAMPDGSVHRRDLRTGAIVQVRPPGSRIVAVSVYANRVAWVTACPGSDNCPQTLSWRTVGSGPVTNLATTGTYRLRLGGARVLFSRTVLGAQLVVTAGLGDHAVQSIGSAVNPWAGSFDLYDETVAWTDNDSRAKVAPLPAHKESPRYLGNAIGAASFHPPALWRGAFPLSKPLLDCKVTFRKNGTPVRIIGCANTTTTGLATIAWDGKTGSGKPVSNGTYTWTLTGSDTDGKLLWYNGSGSAITGTVKVV